MRALIEHPDAYALLASDPAIAPSAVEELIRYDSPVQFIARVAIDEFEVSGFAIPKGALVHLSLGSANRDPEKFNDPDRLDLARQPNRHLSFAHGVHFCLGAHLARQTAQIAFSTLVMRFKSLALVAGGNKRGPNPGLRGYLRMELSSAD